MRPKYKQAYKNFKEKDLHVRALMLRIQNSIKRKGEPYLLTKEDIAKVNEAHEAWREFLKIARQ